MVAIMARRYTQFSHQKIALRVVADPMEAAEVMATRF